MCQLLESGFGLCKIGRTNKLIAHGLLDGFCRFAMRWLAHFYYSLTPSFFHRECGDVPFLSCSSLLHLKQVYGLSHGHTPILLGLKPRLLASDFSLSWPHFRVETSLQFHTRHIVTGKRGECDAKSRYRCVHVSPFYLVHLFLELCGESYRWNFLSCRSSMANYRSSVHLSSTRSIRLVLLFQLTTSHAGSTQPGQ